MKKSVPFLSIVIPVFNEQKRIKNLKKVISYLSKQKYKWEVIVVNDGSNDKTIRIINTLKKKLKLKLVSYSENRGKGAAIKEGMLIATGKYRLFLDIDLSTPIEEIYKLIPFLKKYDIVIGSRKMKGSNILIRQSIAREFLGKMFTRVSQKLLQMKVSDFTCGFKCFSKKAAEEIFAKQTVHRWGFDSEILYIGKTKRYSIKEVPVLWKNDPRTRVKFPQDIVHSLTELFKIRLNSYRGLYK